MTRQVVRSHAGENEGNVTGTEPQPALFSLILPCCKAVKVVCYKIEILLKKYILFCFVKKRRADICQNYTLSPWWPWMRRIFL